MAAVVLLLEEQGKRSLRQQDHGSLEETVATAFSAPAENLEDIFRLVLEVVRKQQLAIMSLRQDLEEKSAKDLDTITRLEEQMVELRERLGKEKEAVPAEAPPDDEQSSCTILVNNLGPDGHDATLDLLEEEGHKPEVVETVSHPTCCVQLLRFATKAHARIAKRKIDAAAAAAEAEDKRAAAAAAEEKRAAADDEEGPLIDGEAAAEEAVAEDDEPAVEEEPAGIDDDAYDEVYEDHEGQPEATRQRKEDEDDDSKSGVFLSSDDDDDDDASSSSSSSKASAAAKRQSLKVVTTDLVAEAAGEHEATLLVRHLPTLQAKKDLMELLHILGPEEEPSELNKWGFYTLCFPSKANAVAAQSLVHGLEFGGCRVEASTFVSSQQEFHLARELESLQEQQQPPDDDGDGGGGGDDSKTTTGSVVVLTAVPTDASEAGLLALFPGALECVLVKSRAAHGQFAMGRMVFEDVRCATAAASAALAGEARLAMDVDGESLEMCVGAKAVEVPRTEVLEKRIVELERAIVENDKRQSERMSTARADQRQFESRCDGVEAALETVRDRIQLVWNQLADIHALKRSHAHLETRIGARLETLEKAREAETETLLDDAAHAAARIVFGELEKLHILVPSSSGSSFVASEELFAAAQLREALGFAKRDLANLEVRVENCVTVPHLAEACDAAKRGSGDAPIPALAAQLRAEMVKLSDANKRDVERRCLEVLDEAGAEARTAVRGESEARNHRLALVSGQIDAIADKHDILERTVAATRDYVRAVDRQTKDQIEDGELRTSRVAAELKGYATQVSDLKTVLQQQQEAKSSSSSREEQEVLSEAKVRAVLAAVADRLEAEIAKRSVSREVFEVLKQEVASRTVSREDVLRLLAQGLRGLRPADDGLMIGKLPYRCLGCNRPISKMHASHASKVVHAGLSPIPATAADHLAYAAASGRAGALRPLIPQSSPGVPRSS